MTTALLFGLALTGCKNDVGVGQGASGVGNPGSSKQQLARGSEVTVTSATVHTDSLDISLCSGLADPVVLDAEVDLLDDAPVEVPGGQWCALEALWTPPLVVEGASEDGEPGKGTFRVELDISSVFIPIQPGFLVDTNDLILELGSGNWLAKSDLHLEDGQHVDLRPGDPLHDRIADAVELGSALFDDADGNGVLDDAERSAGAVGTGALYDPTPPDDDDD